MNLDFTKLTTSKQGYPVKDIKFLSLPGFWAGMIKDPKGTSPEKWVTCGWDKRDKCRNRLRTDLDLL